MSEIQFDPTEHPHRRLNLLTGEWVLVSPHRTKRPWQGQVEKTPADEAAGLRSDLLSLPRQRARRRRHAIRSTPTPLSSATTLLRCCPTARVATWRAVEFFQMRAETGICRVICFSPRHDLTLPEMELADIRKVVDLWSEQMVDLGGDPAINYVQIFENKGAVMGCSNPHPHGQIWSNYSMPQEPAKEDPRQREYFAQTGSPLLVDYVNAEIEAGERIVVQNEHWVALVPYWAVWPFEIMLAPRRHVLQLPDLTDDERDALADAMKQLLTCYDNLFETSFPYSMGWHGQPTDGQRHEHWQLHAHYYPPLLRSATVKKFMVGYEMLANPATRHHRRAGRRPPAPGGRRALQATGVDKFRIVHSVFSNADV